MFYFAELPLKMFQEEKGGDSNAINKLLAMMVYKNEFPDDFDNLASGKESKLEKFINDIGKIKSSLVDLEININENEITELNLKIVELKSHLTTDLDVLMTIRMQQVLDKNSYHEVRVGDSSYSSVKNIKDVEKFWKKLFQNNMKYEDYYRNNKEVKELSELEKDIFHSYLFDNKNMNEMLREWTSKKEKLENKNEWLQRQVASLSIKEVLNRYTDNPVVVPEIEIPLITENNALNYLVRQGLIDFDYTDFISPDPYDLTSLEENFVRIVINRKKIDTADYRLARVEKVIHEINSLDSSPNMYKYAYSPDILAYFAEETTSTTYMSYINILIESARNKTY